MAARSALILFGVGMLVLVPGDALAQREAPRLPWLGFSANGVWRGRARAVRATRARLLAGRQFNQLNAPALARAVPSTVVSGSIVEPVVLFKFQDTPAGAILGDHVAYDSVLYGGNPPSGRPYTLRTYYEQLSTRNGNPPLMTITGKSFGFVALSQSEVAYTGAPGTCSGNPYGTTNCNGIFSYAAFSQLQGGLREALQLLDNGVDWTQFTSHGDTLDLVVFVQPAKDAACGGYPSGSAAGNNHIWSHRSTLITPYVTHSMGPGGSALKVVDYIIESGVGGANFGCDTTQLMPIGTAAHEHGHGFDLPDLYDTYGSSEGIGEYSLMSSGNYTSSFSPSRMDAWSLSQLGWVTVAPLTGPGDYQFGGAPVSDTTYYVRVTGANPRGEYFLLENRQRLQSDSALIRVHGGGGLLVYHVDSAQMANHGFDGDNAVNYGPIHGLAIEQADGRGDLDAGRNRGDAGDPYPGTSGNTAFSFNTNPAAVKNSDGSFVGVAVDSIRQVVPNGAMRFRLRFGAVTVVRASDTAAVVQVDATDYHVFRNLLDSGSVHTVSIADTQYTNANRTREVFLAWSNGQGRTQTYTAAATADTLIATLARAHQLTFTAGPNGSVAVNPAQDTSGSYLSAPATLTATPAGGYLFAGWTGDTTTVNATLTLPMTRPYAVTANFGTTLAISTLDTLPGAIMGAAYLDTLQASGGTGSYTWQLIGQAPPSLSLTASGVLSGTPSQAGTFSLQARVTSASLQVTDTFTLITTTPTLSTPAVVAQILNGSGTLTAGELTYLDLLGNQNNGFDVGDFLAWVNATGAPLVSAPPKRVTPKAPSQ